MRRSVTTYYPPAESELARLAVRLVMPYLHWRSNLSHLDCAVDDRDRLRAATQGGPAVLCPNHPSLDEPLLIHDLLDQERVRANYISSWHSLRVAGIYRPVIRGVGAFSIRRGTADRQALAEAKRVLRDGRNLVIFPEGETYGLNDTLILFQEGAVQMAFWGLQEWIKAGGEPRLPLVPIFVRYVYERDMRPTIDAALHRLEARLGLPQPSAESRYERLRRVGFATCQSLEREFQLEVASDAPLDEHIEALQRHVLTRVADGLGMNLGTGSMQDQMRRLFARIHEEMFLADDDGAATPYARQVAEQRSPAWQVFERDLARLQTFQAVRDGYVAAHPSQERYLDVIARLDLEVLGQRRPFGPRRAVIKVGEPIDLAAERDAYQADRRGTVSRLTGELRDRVQALQETTRTLTPPIEPPRDEVAGDQAG